MQLSDTLLLMWYNMIVLMFLYLFIDGYALIAVNTTVNCSILGSGSVNKKKRKFAECNDENGEEKDWVPKPKLINVSMFV